jgi:hypothetical protein
LGCAPGKKWPPACNIEFHQKSALLPEGLNEFFARPGGAGLMLLG